MARSSYEPIPFENEEHSPTDNPNDHYPPSLVKPATYYGEGEFDPPSSDEEDDLLIEKRKHSASGDAAHEDAGDALNEDMELMIGGQKRFRRPSSLRCLVICLAALVAIATVIGIFAALSYRGTSFQIHGTQHITMEHIFNGTFSARSGSVRWIPEAGDGVFATSQHGNISLVDLKSNATKTLININDVRDEDGRQLSLTGWDLSSDMKYILIKTDYLKQWRHSSFGNYYVYDLEAHQAKPLLPPSDPPVTAYAKWSPTGQSIAFVASNDLYVLPDPTASSAVRVTSSGNASLFHGVPDWVYEEEVFSNDYALWWSPDANKVAFLTFDETAVDEFTFPIYNPTENSYTVVPYPGHVTMKYPKPGYNNPIVSVNVFALDDYLDAVDDGDPEEDALDEATLELTWEGRIASNNSVISEVAWVGNSTLLVKEVNRAATNGSVVLFNLDAGAINTLAIYPLPENVSPGGAPSYLDIVPNADGYNHIALFSPATSSTPRFLTSGSWEVTDNILAVDPTLKLVYFQAANPSSIERHIYSVPLPDNTSQDSEVAAPKRLTDPFSAAFYSASFSPQGGYSLLSYQGPNAPWQKIIQPSNSSFDYAFSENKKLNNTLNQYELPVVIHSTMESDGYTLNVREIRPPRMDDSGKTKYPVLFNVYGGPNSQQVNLKYNIDWHYYLASFHKYIVVVVDGRGTGLKGRRLRNPVKDNLGYWETIDQVSAAKLWASKDYVDPKRIGIWGWSYGGFMSSKVVEADAGVHSLAMAIAPVTSWRLYDSIYTERYMNLPELNPDGYITASISNATAFHKVDFLFAHGSADDNVHFANSAHLLDMLTREKVRNFRFRMFTDSDHSIYRRGANREVYEYMTGFLAEKWGKGPRQRGW
ncbi:hypothetical protein NM688_g763 [Phlebia brevispora]|uniref:Uncharacterized protein n=1 Tax=Phlebia brevispora TaxID=194682 RepID=A0ACC1TDN5_9APHY|nr:hypothetical protein NM688_g763 [Phlebia brevispora]